MTAGHGVPHVGGPDHPHHAAQRYGLALLLLVAAGYIWYRVTATGGEILALFTWAPLGRSEPRTAWELAPIALMMSVLVAMVPAGLVLGAAAVGRLKNPATVSGLALTGLAAATIAVWLVR